jgi:zinc transporter ZupT
MTTSESQGITVQTAQQPALNPLKSNPNSKYDDPYVAQQRFEGWILSAALVITVSLTFFVWWYSAAWWACVVLAALGGMIGGLLHSLKWFYRTIGDGEWEWDRLWWRFMSPLVSGVMGFSIYIVFRSGIDPQLAAVPGNPSKETLYAYSIGFLAGLFADNAMNKLRDIAHLIFGSPAPSKAKPQKPEAPRPESPLRG